MKHKSNRIVLLLIGFLPLVFWLFTYLNADIWYDEIVTFERFALTDFGTPLLNYPFPNNHVLYSFLTQCLAYLINCLDLKALFQSIPVFRGFQAIFMLVTALYSYKITERFFKVKHTVLIFVVLFTTIPFMNFGLQLRGYNMSATLLVMILYYVWKLVEKPKFWTGMVLVILSASLLYTIPSNIYALASIMIALGVIWIVKKRTKNIESQAYFYAPVLLIFGIIVSLILYLPILENVIFNDYSIKRPEDFWYSLKLIPLVFSAFLSNRWALLLPLIIGLWYILKSENIIRKQHLFVLITSIVFPFILSFIHQRFPFDRIFVVIVPFFCILLVVALDQCLSQLKTSRFVFLLSGILSIYCVLTFYYEIERNDSVVISNLDKGEITQNIYQNYYLSTAFHPSKSAAFIENLSDYDTLIKYNQLDFPSVNQYLLTKDIEFTQVNSPQLLDSLATTVNTAIVITSFKKKTMMELSSYPINVRILNDDHSFMTVLELKKK